MFTFNTNFFKERQVQLAYVTTEAKPPREVRRKQAKFGTGSGVHPSVPVAVPSRSVPQAHHRNLGSSPAKKQAGMCTHLIAPFPHPHPLPTYM